MYLTKKKKNEETMRTIIKEFTFLSLKSQKKRGKVWNFLKKYLNK